MFKVTIAGKYHTDTALVAAIDRILVADGSTRLDDGGDAGFVGQFHTIVKWEESIGSQHRSMKVETERVGFLDSLAKSVNPRGLANARGAQLTVFSQGDGVGTTVLDHFVGEDHVVDFRW